MSESLVQTSNLSLIPKQIFDPNYPKPIQPKTLTELIELLYEAFASNEVNIDYVYTIMNNYKGTMKEWASFIKFQPDRYTRNLVDGGNGKFNLMILCWAESQGSSIHNHTNSHCMMKCLQGKLIETRYAWPTVNQEEPMHIIARGELSEGQVAYINDAIGLHRVENPSHTETSVTLHLYIPPYDHCNIFDERTSRTNESNVTFYSIGGQLTANQ